MKRYLFLKQEENNNRRRFYIYYKESLDTEQGSLNKMILTKKCTQVKRT
jgi:hypothetical protein